MYVLSARRLLREAVRVRDLGRGEDAAEEEAHEKGVHERRGEHVLDKPSDHDGTDNRERVRDDRGERPRPQQIRSRVRRVDEEGDVRGQVERQGRHVQDHTRPKHLQTQSVTVVNDRRFDVEGHSRSNEVDTGVAYHVASGREERRRERLGAAAEDRGETTFHAVISNVRLVRLHP